MDNETVDNAGSQADFIQNELNFDVDLKDPLTKATLEDHEEDEWMDVLGVGQLKKKVVKAGQKGTRPNRSDICSINLTGKLEDGTVVEKYEKFTIQLGDVEVIQGLDLVIALMDVEEVAEVEVEARFGYGDLGREPDIPGGAKLFYTIELLSVEMEPEIETLGIAQRKNIGNKKRERGNWWYSRDEASLAVQCYRRALDYLDETKGGINYPQGDQEESISNADLQALLEDRMKVCNNLAAAQMKTEAYDAALKSVENVLRCQPKNVKALFRKGKILQHKGERAAAYAILLQAAKLDPDSKAIQQELAILKEKTAKDAKHEKNLYKKMLGTDKQNGSPNKNTNNQNPKTTPSTIAWSLIGGAVAAIAGVIVYRKISCS
ncbi:peptidyl-prolyl cis-trans isomerase FKBP8 [Neodiprion virginianus]|uniref:peptidylprolyl isomerase n=1 Tax=Neodiprion lecontei TaxID=441921 RepID=A0A6J0C351_NEOLC|nr:peptidyl-prolyl cis-trans isomerase FKBP8 [Neodiprion lecontei]XP_015520957.1 peptidyl-prolyl cis-trans isomerase FKBP8 [Neodiprion lecontei]XP_046427834.1 peptidyl-prolyl cis-trans isomerase FKBP8 [Neodiprion fabricii]XP_046427835.1 peptidyl-prolyl cis-trans isomerase FKBP8 [Neodiprion fabricii]XP_046621264.1 peptidyl-prolyl cis-trans isomerase FKBP8 [Neodiprion virginianus]XP_046621265.1 peptidyl-prolyl cis-trans isomerase FKBP8 [Neodiprion virginianus]